MKKLILTSAEAGSSDLHDEYIAQKKVHRIRVTQRPSSTRIQYKLTKEGRVQFLQYYGEGEHDDGL